MVHRITYTTFVASLSIALLGGVLLVLCQLLGLALGHGGILSAPNGIFKTVLCIAASVASVAAYLLVHTVGVGSSRATTEGTR